MLSPSINLDLPLNHPDAEVRESNKLQQAGARENAKRRLLALLDEHCLNMGDQEAADFLTEHFDLLIGIAYLPNLITIEIVQEARGKI